MTSAHIRRAGLARIEHRWTGAAEGPQRPSVLTSETSDSVQIGDKGLEQSRTGEKKPHDSNVYSPA